LHERAAELVNRLSRINRVIAPLASLAPMATLTASPAALCRTRLERLRRADAIVREAAHRTGFDKEVWQFPVILVPLGTADRPDSVVLRPVDSVDGMTARAVPLPQALREELCQRLLAEAGICAVFLDLTHKPPGTIEWE
jgi:GMP synthase (glutamine-hydrolysing)